MEYKTITKPDGSEQKLAVYDGKCRFWMEGLYDSLPDTAEKRAEECSLPVKIDRREDGTVGAVRAELQAGLDVIIIRQVEHLCQIV